MDSTESSDLPRKKRRTPALKRDPNEQIPANWQRKPHVADRMPVLRASDPLQRSEDGTRISVESPEQLNYGVGDYVFVATEFTPPPRHASEDLGAPPPTFRVGRIMEVETTRIRVNWLLRPVDVYRGTSAATGAADTRELYVTFDAAWVPIDLLRGKCIVQCRQDIRRVSKYREKSSQFWFSRLYSRRFSKLYDVVPVPALRSLGSQTTAKLTPIAAYAVLEPAESQSLMEQPKRRRMQSTDDETAASDSLDESSLSEEASERLAREREMWPFRFFDAASHEFAEPGFLPRKRRIGSEFQVPVDSWPGKPLVYYTVVPSPDGSTAEQRKLVEPTNDDDEGVDGSVSGTRSSDELDVSQPWVQKMPSGYIPRGGDATSTPVSKPVPGIADFVAKCQSSYAENIEVQPHAVNFLDACCSIFVNNTDSIDDAFVTVSRLTRKLLREPDLQPSEAETFQTRIAPFTNYSWHDVFKAVGSKPVLELCQYLWVNLPLHPMVPANQLVWDGSDPTASGDESGDNDNDDDNNNENENENEHEKDVEAGDVSAEKEGSTTTEDAPSKYPLICVSCLTDSAAEWTSLPGYIPILMKPEFERSRVALCNRCARLWYRYHTSWIPPPELKSRLSELEEAEEDDDRAIIEPELIDDTKSYLAESERRQKRRTAAQEKKEAMAKKREEAKLAKKAAKEAKKSGQVIESEIKPPSPTGGSISTPGGAEAKDKDAKKPKQTKKKKQERDEDGDKTSASSSARKKIKKEPSAAADSEDSTDIEELSGRAETTNPNSKKKAGAIAMGTSYMSLDQVDEILDEIDVEKPSEAAEYSNYCVVCGQLDPSMSQATCVSCGLNVHTACYGAVSQTDGNGHSTAWLCDCCLNSRGKLINDQFYQCRLCPERTPRYGSWLNGNGINAPDALKNTIDKNWCHIRCAIWTPGVTFGDPVRYRDIDLSSVSRENTQGFCAICRESISHPKPTPTLPPPNSSSATNVVGGSSGVASGIANSVTAASKLPTHNSVADTSAPEEIREARTPEITNSTPTATSAAADRGTSAPAVPAGTPGSRSSTSASSSSTTQHPAAVAATVPTITSAYRITSVNPDTQAFIGSKVKCELCDDRFHVSCAADSGYKLGLTKDSPSRPVIICNRHSGVELIPMSKLDLNTNLSAMQMYVGTHKVSKRRCMTALDRCKRVDDEDKVLYKSRRMPVILPLAKPRDPSNENSLIESLNWNAPLPLKCARCRTDSSSYWFINDNNNEEVLCPLCHRGLTPVGPRLDELNVKALKNSVANKVYAFMKTAALASRRDNELQE